MYGNFTYICRRVLACVVVSCVSVSCIRDDYNGPDLNLPTRTVLVYLAGDNNLSGETEQKVEAMRRGWGWTSSTLLVYEDRRDMGARLLRIRGGCSVTPVPYVETIREYGSENSASAATLERVLREVMTEYPADSYGMIFFSHASGWLPAGRLQNPTRAFGWDNGSPEGGLNHAEMELTDFAAAIPDGALDFIVFETCLTAGIEVAYELRRKADYILASSAEIVSPGFTPVYSTALLRLFDTSKSIRQGLTDFGMAYMNYVNTLGGNYRSATLSLVQTAELEILAARIREMVQTNEGAEEKDLSELQHFDRPGSYGDSPALPRYFDLQAWVEQRGTPEQYAAFGEHLKRIVRWTASTESFMLSQNGFMIDRHCGLTTYILQPEFPALNEAYRQTAWYKAVWNQAE